MAEEFLNSSEDVDEILKIAIRKTSVGGDELRHRLLQSANELGISPEALEAATQEHRVKKMLEKYRESQAAAFNHHLVPYVLVNLMLIVIWAMTSFRGGMMTTFWPIFSILGWGIGLASHAVASFRRVEVDDPNFQAWLRERDSVSGNMSNGTF